MFVALLSGCVAPDAVDPPAARDLGSICRQLRVDLGAALRRFPRTPEEVSRLTGVDLLVVLTGVERRSVGGMDRDTLAALRRFVTDGGRVLLLGFATNLVHELGVEPRAPDRFSTYRWGVTNNTVLGSYVYGFAAERDEMCGLPRELHPPKGEDRAWFLGGGEMVHAQCCHWEAGDPERGLVMGRMFRERDGERRHLTAAVLTYWNVGRGAILAYGNLPEPWRSETKVGANAKVFLRNAARALCRGAPKRVVVFVEGAPIDVGSSLQPLPRLADRRLPGAPLLPHWGWQVALNYQHEATEPLSREEIVLDAVDDSFRAGADLLDLQLADLARGYPFPWSDDDPLHRPDAFQGGAFWPQWTPGTVRQLVLASHQRGMLVQAYLDPPLAPGGTPAEAMQASRWFAREFMDVRRFGNAALDGVGLHTWFEDEAACAGVFRQYHPGCHGYHTGLHPSRLPGFVPAVHGDHGAPSGVHAAGVSRRWREGPVPARRPIGALDSRNRAAPRPRWGGRHADGGGSYGDWIVTQANDFVRERIGVGAGLWWKAFNRRMMSRETLAYVRGVSMLPIKAAVAGRLWATGVGGYRDLVASFVGDVQSGFGAESTLPARTPFLQNNFIKVHGTAGPLQIDPTGRALFGDDSALANQRPFMHSKWRGIRFALGPTDAHPVDFIAGASRGTQGYGPMVVITAEQQGRGTFPARLSYDDPGRWPRKVEVRFHADKANYTLRLSLRGVSGRGVVELRREGELLRLFAFEERDEPELYTVPLPMALSGERALSLEVVDGGTVAVTGCRLEHGGSVLLSQSVPTESRVVEFAGPLAQLEEVSGSQFINERRLLTTIADLPGFALTIEYEYTRSVAEVVREFHLPGYRRVVSSTGRVRHRHRGSIILGHDDPAVPDLMVAVITMPRDHYLTFGPGGLRLVGTPRTKHQVQIGFLLLRERHRDVGVVRRIFKEVLDPLVLQLDDSGIGVVRPGVLAPHPRVVRVIHDRSTPFRVREGGYWFHRGGQPAREAGVYLHIYHVGDSPVRIEAFDPVGCTAPRPGPGSLRSMVLQEPEDHSVIVHLEQVGPLLRAPSVVMPASFNAVTINGEPWRYFDGRRVYLPRRPGLYRVEVNTEVDTNPHLLRTGGSVDECVFDAAAGELVVRFSAATGHTAWVSGAPVAVEGGEVIAEHDYGYRVAQHRQSLSQGVVVRLEAPVLKVRYAKNESLSMRLESER